MAEAPRTASFVIRPAGAKDVDDIVDIWLEGAFQSFGVSPPSRAVVREFFSHRFSLLVAPYGIWVAVEGRKVIGWQGLQQHYPNPMFRSALSSTYIREGYHAQGVGRLLLEFATEYAKEAGINNIFGHIFIQNYASMRLVESLGWTRVGVIPLAHNKEYYYYCIVVSPSDIDHGESLANKRCIAEEIS